MDVTIYHNPKCGTSRNVLGFLREAGIEPEIILYLETPPNRTQLEELIELMDISPRDLLRQKGTPFDELGLGDETLPREALIDAMLAHPALINRPIVVTPNGARLCRPAETEKELLEMNGSDTKTRNESIRAKSVAD